MLWESEFLYGFIRMILKLYWGWLLGGSKGYSVAVPWWTSDYGWRLVKTSKKWRNFLIWWLTIYWKKAVSQFLLVRVFPFPSHQYILWPLYNVLTVFLFIYLLYKKKEIFGVKSLTPYHVTVMDNTICTTRVIAWIAHQIKSFPYTIDFSIAHKCLNS